ncbi:hypothetical protein P154DRAFT_540760 [Amniculicola lignicola CBS 123094]|uniref:Uncharacterized protein n=1 Tax=Amniculicola lignicola CBS 123094 TaxID=1392246 RepID=A0A6A5VWD3_9PLEO|nr:hypothetical protein P154DRAFT_540760 [Amniculicola lignicola CBS 123094]
MSPDIFTALLIALIASLIAAQPTGPVAPKPTLASIKNNSMDLHELARIQIIILIWFMFFVLVVLALLPLFRGRGFWRTGGVENVEAGRVRTYAEEQAEEAKIKKTQ